jgi:hypothetical protein
MWRLARPPDKCRHPTQHALSEHCMRPHNARSCEPSAARAAVHALFERVANWRAAPTVPKRPGCRPHRVSGGWPQGDIASQSVRKMCEGWEAAHLLPLHADVDLGAARGQRV